MKVKLIECQGEIEKSVIRVRDFNMLISKLTRR